MSINYLYLYIDNIEQIEYNNLSDLIMVMFYTVIILIIFMCSLLFYKNQTLNIVKRLDIRLKEKYDFIKLSLMFLGHIISNKGIYSDNEKVKKLQELFCLNNGVG